MAKTHHLTESFYANKHLALQVYESRLGKTERLCKENTPFLIELFSGCSLLLGISMSLVGDNAVNV